MNSISSNIVDIIPITRARPKLGDLAEKVTGENYIVLTKGGKKTALVDLEYLNNLEREVQKIYKKTFIDPALLPYTRSFSDDDIKSWQEEDTF